MRGGSGDVAVDRVAGSWCTETVDDNLTVACERVCLIGSCLRLNMETVLAARGGPSNYASRDLSLHLIHLAAGGVHRHMN